MESEPDYGQYWTPDGRSAQDQSPQQPAYEPPPQPGYEPQPEYGQQQFPDYGAVGYQQPSYEQPSYDQPSYEQYEPQPYQQQPGYEQQQSYEYSGYQGYSEYPQQPPHPQPYGEQPYGAGAGQGGYDGAATGTYQADSAAVPAAPAEGEAATTDSGSTAVGGGRSARRAARGGAESAPVGAPTFARLLAAATGRAPGTDRKTFIVRAALGAAAVVVLGVAGFAVAGSGSGPAKPKAAAGPASPSVDLATAHTKVWAAAADAGSAKGNDGLVGSWLLPNAVVRGDGIGVAAYATTGGSRLWSVAPPVSGAVPCAMSSTVGSGGVGAVLFQAKPGSGQPCSLLVAVNTATGASSWKATLPGSPTGQSSVMVSDTLVVAVDGSAATGYNASTGKQSWRYGGPGKYCVLAGNGTAGTLLLQSTCADTNPKQQVISLNADTGKLGWWRGLPSSAASYTVLSAVPAVVGVHMTNPVQDTLMSFTAQGDSQASIPVSQVGGLLDSLNGSFDADPALFFQGDTMLAELSPTTTPGATTAATSSGVITAFDLASGKQLWQTAPAQKGQSALVGVDGAGAVVATEERIGQPAMLSHFDLGTGKETPGGAFPQATGSLLTAGRLLFQGSDVAVLPEFTSTYGTAATLYSGGSNG
jgi:PQQ-like domain